MKKIKSIVFLFTLQQFLFTYEHLPLQFCSLSQSIMCLTKISTAVANCQPIRYLISHVSTLNDYKGNYLYLKDPGYHLR